jgi:hypothetical protein
MLLATKLDIIEVQQNHWHITQCCIFAGSAAELCYCGTRIVRETWRLTSIGCNFILCWICKAQRHWKAASLYLHACVPTRQPRAISDIFAAMSMKVTVFRDVTPHSLVYVYRYFRARYSTHYTED